MFATLGRSWRHFRWSMYERPGFTFMVTACFASPFLTAIGVSVLRRFDYQRSIPLPRSYPLPDGPRQPITGYDDEE